jgi:ERCC4-type nuclease
MSTLWCDTRQVAGKHIHVDRWFEARGIPYEYRKLDFGDYMTSEHGVISIDRKQSIDELAKNCAAEHDRFRRELERAQKAGATLYLLVEQNSYTFRGEHVRVHEPIDLLRWQSKYSVVTGERIYRVLSAWQREFGLKIVFCSKRSTGLKITQILFGDNNEG